MPGKFIPNPCLRPLLVFYLGLFRRYLGLFRRQNLTGQSDPNFSPRMIRGAASGPRLGYLSNDQPNLHIPIRSENTNITFWYDQAAEICEEFRAPALINPAFRVGHCLKLPGDIRRDPPDLVTAE